MTEAELNVPGVTVQAGIWVAGVTGSLFFIEGTVAAVSLNLHKGGRSLKLNSTKK
jgi:hypothetical protein